MTRFASGEAGFLFDGGEAVRAWRSVFFERIGSEEKNIIFGGRGCRALPDASKDTSFRLEGHIYKRHPPTNRRLGDGDLRGKFKNFFIYLYRHQNR